MNDPRPGLNSFYPAGRRVRSRLQALLIATVVAATMSTLVQVLLWWLFTPDWWALLMRDSRLAAALLLGPAVLPPPSTFDTAVMLVATGAHGGLSLLFTAVLARFVEGRPPATAMLLGTLFGLALYGATMHVATLLFPWFVQARGWITVAAHVAFGVSGALAWSQARPARLA
jgi:hypothetical protein